MTAKNSKTFSKIFDELFDKFKYDLISKWYPLVLDKESGGYFTNLSHDWKIESEQEKMIVTQSRHLWTLSKIYEILGEPIFLDYAYHGYRFLKEKMWDEKYGGFYQIRNRSGNHSDIEGWADEKRTYGNAFAIFGLSALYNHTKNQEVFELAEKTFYWLEKHAHDAEHLGYFQFMKRDGDVFNNKSDYKTIATDKIEADYKDQNSSIHLLEAFTEFYSIWKNEFLRTRLNEMLVLIRDKMIHKKGYLQLFFEPDWKPISFRNAKKEIRESNYRLDHVSFGHDYESAFLLLEASYKLNLENDNATLKKAKQMLDHAIVNGWDNENGGFFDEGYYFDEDGNCEIIKNTKTWWIQAEGLNALLLFSKIFPDEKKYFELFTKLWNYIKTYLIDKENGGWYWASLEKQPFYKNERKANIWKAAYHDGRALINCLLMLADESYGIYKTNEHFHNAKNKMEKFISHWKETAKLL